MTTLVQGHAGADSAKGGPDDVAPSAPRGVFAWGKSAKRLASDQVRSTGTRRRKEHPAYQLTVVRPLDINCGTAQYCTVQ